MRVLGIETSCDETAAAVVDGRAIGQARILSNVVRSQVEDHSAFGGVVPEIAARAHAELLDRVIASAMEEASVPFGDLDAIAVTAGPGLIGGLMVGTVTARAIGAAASLPVIGINHLEGHALTPVLTDGVPFPFILLLVSGGHTQIVRVTGVGRYERLATTIDDALGEAFDKTAKLLGLGYPGGPAVERAALAGQGDAHSFPRPLGGREGLDMSFSGLKTAVRRAAVEHQPLDEARIADICASFQAAAGDVLADRTARAMQQNRDASTLVVAGGVAANAELRSRLEAIAAEIGRGFVAPPLALCGDNAAMIAHAGLLRLLEGMSAEDFVTRPRWPLDDASAPLVGSGKRGAKV